jgi:aldehyde dehydrogenase (NAD+)
MIVDSSANVEYAAAKASFGGFLNSGQTCIRPDYILIQSNLVHQFVKNL